MGRGSAIEAGKAFVKFLLDDSEFQKKLGGIGRKLTNFGRIGAAVSGPVVAALGACLAVGISLGGELSDLSDQTGVAASSLSRLSFVADEGGVSLQDLGMVIKKLQATLGNPTPELRKTIHQLGLDFNALKQLAPEDQFVEIGAAIAGIADVNQRAAFAKKFGKQFVAILPMLSKGAAAFREASDEAVRLGAALSDDEVKKLDALGDLLGHSKQQLQGLASQVALALSGPLTEFLHWSQEIIIPIIAWIKENPQLVQTIAKVTAAIFGASLATFALGNALQFIVANPYILGLIAIGVAATYIAQSFRKATLAAGALATVIGLLTKNPKLVTAGLIGISAALLAGAPASTPPLQAQTAGGTSRAVRTGAGSAVSPAAASRAQAAGGATATDEGIAWLKEIATSNLGILAAIRSKPNGMTLGAT